MARKRLQRALHTLSTISADAARQHPFCIGTQGYSLILAGITVFIALRRSAQYVGSRHWRAP